MSKPTIVLSDGYILTRVPSIISPIFPRYPRKDTKAGTITDRDAKPWYVFAYWIGGEKFEFDSWDELHVEHERGRLLAWARSRGYAINV